MKTEVRYFMNQPSGQLQGFLLFEKWAKVWDDYLKGLNLSGREHANQNEFDAFKEKYSKELRILEGDENILVTYP